jgi:hypothetical protein
MRQRPAWRDPDPAPRWVAELPTAARVAFIVSMFALVMFIVTGCAGEPIVRTEVVTVNKPIPVPCRTKPVPVPAWALNSIAPDADVFTLAKTALAEIEQRIQYETQLIAAVAACQ